MKRSEMIDIILNIFEHTSAFSDEEVASKILEELEKAGMLPPHNLQTVCIKKGLTRGYTLMFEWDDE